MPNPLMQTFRDRSKRPPRNPGIAGVEERQIVIDNPEMEHYAGSNNAYRGTEQHGVKTDEHATAYDPGEHDGHSEVVSPMPIKAVVEPIPVLVVNEYGSESKQFRAYSFPVSARAQQIVNAHPMRKSVTIKNPTASANPVYINSDSTLSLITGFPLDPGQEVLIYTETEVWAMCAAGQTATLRILDQYSVELP